MSNQLTAHEARLVNHAWDCASRHRTLDKYRSFLRGFQNGRDDSPAMRQALRSLEGYYKALYG